MRKNFLLLLLAMSCLLARSQSLSPTVVATGGGVSKFANIELEWTLGESVIGQSATNSRLYTNGFHQPVIVSPAGRTQELVLNSAIRVYPNPVENNLIVQFDSPTEGNIKLVISDITGRLLKEKTITSNTTSSDLSFKNIAAGVYLLRIVDKNENTVTSFKIVKPN